MAIHNFPGTDDSISPRNSVVFESIGAAKSISLQPHQRTVLLDCTAAVALTVTLPPVAFCSGNIYTFNKRLAAGTMVIQDDNDDGRVANITLSAANSKAIFISDGYAWHAITPDA